MNNKATTEVVQTQQANGLDNRMKLYPWYLYNMILAKNLFRLHNKRIILLYGLYFSVGRLFIDDFWDDSWRRVMNIWIAVTNDIRVSTTPLMESHFEIQ